ncbi:MAG: hypothetical protein ACLSB9_19925 [Hydrogeniiclostridium mannosilyticum]
MEEAKINFIHENVHIPFENDEKIVGKWEIIGEYHNQAAFNLGKKLPEEGSAARTVKYFSTTRRVVLVLFLDEGQIVDR